MSVGRDPLPPRWGVGASVLLAGLAAGAVDPMLRLALGLWPEQPVRFDPLFAMVWAAMFVVAAGMHWGRLVGLRRRLGLRRTRDLTVVGAAVHRGRLPEDPRLVPPTLRCAWECRGTLEGRWWHRWAPTWVAGVGASVVVAVIAAAGLVGWQAGGLAATLVLAGGALLLVILAGQVLYERHLLGRATAVEADRDAGGAGRAVVTSS